MIAIQIKHLPRTQNLEPRIRVFDYQHSMIIEFPDNNTPERTAAQAFVDRFHPSAIISDFAQLPSGDNVATLKFYPSYNTLQRANLLDYWE
jgi:hypothetical protein